VHTLNKLILEEVLLVGQLAVHAEQSLGDNDNDNKKVEGNVTTENAPALHVLEDNQP
jgi:hypothetical protein